MEITLNCHEISVVKDALVKSQDLLLKLQCKTGKEPIESANVSAARDALDLVYKALAKLCL